MSYGTIQIEKMTTESGYSLGAGNASSFKNRIINGEMDIDQRNAGASLTITTDPQYCLDRWKFGAISASRLSAQQSSVAPPGFTRSVLITSLAATSVGASDYYGFQQDIEGFNIADLGFGTANAKSITVSFWVRSSLTGQFGGSIRNLAQNRSYPFSYTISAANTFEYKTVTIPGDTTGTWATDNSVGLRLTFALGVGSTFTGTANAWAATNLINSTGSTNFVSTNGATMYITGVQLEVGTVATSFDFRSIGTELALCQRYYEKSFSLNVAPGNSGSSTSIGATEGSVTGMAQNRLNAGPTVQFKVVKRAIPTMQKYGNSSGDWIYALQTANSWAGGSNTGLTRVSESSFSADQQAVDATAIFVSGHWAASAEL